MRNSLFILFICASVLMGTANGVEVTPAFEGFAVGGASHTRSTLLNPANTVLGIPDWTTEVDLRPTLDATYRENWRAIFRPRYLGGVHGTTTNGVSATITDSRLQVDEAYLRWEASDSLNLTAGILNFQWGPAELMGPSNPLVHFHSDQRSLLYRPRGKILARAVYSFSSDVTAVLLIEPLNNGEASWIADQDFMPRALLKVEKRFANAANYLGVTGGREDQGQGFFGQYGNVYLNDSLSLYVDARETWGSPGYYPVGTTIVQSHFGDQTPFALATAGIRYEGSADFRLEYIYNSYGLRQSELVALTSLLYANPALIARGLQPGRELTQQHYLYASIRSDKLGHGDSLRVAVRYLFSPVDQSGSLLANLEWAFTDNLTFLAQPVIYHGSSTSEFAQGPNWEFLGGLRAAF